MEKYERIKNQIQTVIKIEIREKNFHLINQKSDHWIITGNLSKKSIDSDGLPKNIIWEFVKFC